MPRQARLDAPGTLHHAMVRGIERPRLFRDDVDRADFLAPAVGLHPAVVYKAARREAAQAREWERLLEERGNAT